MPSFKIIYTKSAVKDIKKLDPVAKKRIRKKLDKFAGNPLQYGKKLIDSSLGDYRWRMGNYRIVFDVHGQTIVILRAGHRRDVYKK